ALSRAARASDSMPSLLASPWPPVPRRGALVGLSPGGIGASRFRGGIIHGPFGRSDRVHRPGGVALRLGLPSPLFGGAVHQYLGRWPGGGGLRPRRHRQRTRPLLDHPRGGLALPLGVDPAGGEHRREMEQRPRGRPPLHPLAGPGSERASDPPSGAPGTGMSSDLPSPSPASSRRSQARTKGHQTTSEIARLAHCRSTARASPPVAR